MQLALRQSSQVENKHICEQMLWNVNICAEMRVSARRFTLPIQVRGQQKQNWQHGEKDIIQNQAFLQRQAVLHALTVVIFTSVMALTSRRCVAN